MNPAKLFRFSALMFSAVAVYLFLTAITQAESRFLYIAAACILTVGAVLMSAKSSRTKN